MNASGSIGTTSAAVSHAESDVQRNPPISAADFERIQYRPTGQVQGPKQKQVISREGAEELTQDSLNGGNSINTTLRYSQNPSMYSQQNNDPDDAAILAALDPTYVLWNGHEWTNMDQGPKELTTPDGYISSSTQVDVLESWLTSIRGSDTESDLSGSLNGEWISAYYR
jgi:hypothetical protein